MIIINDTEYVFFAMMISSVKRKGEAWRQNESLYLPSSSQRGNSYELLILH